MLAIYRPALWLPERIQRQLDDQSAHDRWTRHFWNGFTAVIAVTALNWSALFMALHGHGKWCVVPAGLAALPLMWLLHYAVFSRHTPSQDDDQPATDLPSLIHLP